MSQYPQQPLQYQHPQPSDERGVIWLAYVLHGCSFFTGGLTSIVALIINYIKRRDQNLLMSSHMQWQIDTFWRAVIGCVALGVVCFFLFLSVVGVIFVYPLIAVLAIWYAYRLIKGMLALNTRQPVY
jgi:uncharacterized membrane protein